MTKVFSIFRYTRSGLEIQTRVDCFKWEKKILTTSLMSKSTSATVSPLVLAFVLFSLSETTISSVGDFDVPFPAQMVTFSFFFNYTFMLPQIDIFQIACANRNGEKLEGEVSYPKWCLEQTNIKQEDYKLIWCGIWISNGAWVERNVFTQHTLLIYRYPTRATWSGSRCKTRLSEA